MQIQCSVCSIYVNVTINVTQLGEKGRNLVWQMNLKLGEHFKLKFLPSRFFLFCLFVLFVFVFGQILFEKTLSLQAKILILNFLDKKRFD